MFSVCHSDVEMKLNDTDDFYQGQALSLEKKDYIFALFVPSERQLNTKIEKSGLTGTSN